MRLIDADALLSGYEVRKVVEFDEGGWGVDYNAVPVGAIEAAPTIDAVSPGVLEQYKWERDTAIAQLEELGIGFGQKKPDMVEVVRCKDCMHYNHAVIDDDPAETFEVDVCLHKDLFPTRVTLDFFCAHGERKMDAEVHDDA